MARIKINWEEAEGGKFIKQPGEYVVKLTEAELDTDSENRQYIEWTAQVTRGNNKGATIHFKNYLTPKTLWRLRDLLSSIDYPISESVQDLDLDDIIDRETEFVIEVENGNERPDGKGYYMQVSDYMPYVDYEETKKIFESGKKSSPEDYKKQEEDDIDEMEKEIDRLGLDIDLDDYDTHAEKIEAFNKAKKKATEKEEKKKVVYTREMLDDLGSVELDKIANEIGLELDEDASPRSKRRSLIQALKECGRFEE